MRLQEFEAANIFERQGIPFPKRTEVSSAEEARKAAKEIGCQVVLKAQVLVGGRGLAGGVKVAQDPHEAFLLADKMLGSRIRGLPVHRILVAEKVDVAKELYLGVTVDGYEGTPMVLASTEGGVNIEEVSRRFPEKIARQHVEPASEFLPYQARGLLRGLGFSSSELLSVANALVRLYKVFLSCEALITEINPLAILKNGGIMALDAVLEIDESALFRLGDLVPQDSKRIENPLERKGREIGITYVDLDGDIGIISSGAGLGMATMDIVAERLRPANFLETGGVMDEDLMYRIMELMMMKEGLRAIFINVFGGINPIHLGAKGVVRYLKEHDVKIPIAAKALGNRQEETWEILRSGGVHIINESATEKAVEALIELLGDKKTDSVDA